MTKKHHIDYGFLFNQKPDRETVFKNRANGRWEYFTYSDAQRVFISKAQADKMVDQGAKLVVCD